MKPEPDRTALKETIINTIACLFLGGMVFLAFYRVPVFYMRLIAEDGWGEYATFACYLFAFLMTAYAIIARRELRRPGYALLALFLFFIAMEEISWGQRILRLESPDSFKLYNNQNELNLHNLIFIQYTKLAFQYCILLWVAIIPLLYARLDRFKRLSDFLGIPIVPARLSPYFYLALLFSFVHLVPKSDEINELLFAIGFLIFSLDLAASAGGLRDDYGKKSLRTLAIVALAFCVAAFFAWRWPWHEDLRERLNRFTTIIYPKAGLYAQAEELYAYQMKNPQLLRDDTLLSYGLFLIQRGKNEEARRVFNAALEEKNSQIAKRPHEPELYHIRGRIYDQLAKRSEARADYQRQIGELARLLRENGARLGRSGADRPLLMNERMELLFSLGTAYLSLKNYHDALRSFREAEQLSRKTVITTIQRNKIALFILTAEHLSKYGRLPAIPAQ